MGLGLDSPSRSGQVQGEGISSEGFTVNDIEDSDFERLLRESASRISEPLGLEAHGERILADAKAANRSGGTSLNATAYHGPAGADAVQGAGGDQRASGISISCGPGTGSVSKRSSSPRVATRRYSQP